MANSKLETGDSQNIEELPALIPTSEQSFFRRTLKNIVSGTFSGIAVCLVGHPFDTLKVRLQTQPVDRPVYKGLLDCFVKTMKWEGIGGLYKGVGKLSCSDASWISISDLCTFFAEPEVALN